MRTSVPVSVIVTSMPATRPDRTGCVSVEIVKITLEVFLVITGIFLVLLILMHKGKGGGMSDMFGGAMSSTMGGSSVAERNLNRITVGVALVWLACIVGLGLVVRFSG